MDSHPTPPRHHPGCPRNSRSSPMTAILTPYKRTTPQQHQVHTACDHIATQTDQPASTQQTITTTNPAHAQVPNNDECKPTLTQLQLCTPQRAETAQHQQGQNEETPTAVRAIKSSPQMLDTTPANSEQIRRELCEALVVPERLNNELGDEPRPMGSSNAVIFDWLAYDSPPSLNTGQDANQMRTEEVDPAGAGVAEAVESGQELTEPLPSPSIDVHVVYDTVCTWLDMMKTTFAQLWQYRLFRILVTMMSVYYGMGFLERWAVALTALFIRWTWPPMHFMLGSSRGTLYHLTEWFTWMDDFLLSWVCDVSNRYCHQYGVMCESQCSFVGRSQRATSFDRPF